MLKQKMMANINNLQIYLLWLIKFNGYMIGYKKLILIFLIKNFKKDLKLLYHIECGKHFDKKKFFILNNKNVFYSIYYFIFLFNINSYSLFTSSKNSYYHPNFSITIIVYSNGKLIFNLYIFSSFFLYKNASLKFPPIK